MAVLVGSLTGSPPNHEEGAAFAADADGGRDFDLQG